MKLQMVQNALKQKNIKYEYTEEDDCGSLDFMFRGLRFHVWEYHDEVWDIFSGILSFRVKIFPFLRYFRRKKPESP